MLTAKELIGILTGKVLSDAPLRFDQDYLSIACSKGINTQPLDLILYHLKVFVFWCYIGDLYFDDICINTLFFG